MFKLKVLFVAVLSLLLANVSSAASDQEKYTQTITNFKRIETVKPYFGSAYGYAVFPTIGKGGMGIGAAHGKGQVYRSGVVTGVASLTDISFGFQLGGQAYSQVVFFKDARAYDDFTSGNFEFDAQAGAVAVTASAQAQAGTGGGFTAGASESAKAGGSQTQANYHKGLLVFVLGKGGLMYEATIGGQKYGFKPNK